ncbi:cobalt-zinc-cadmium efflux system protein [Paraoerskovia marina]|uniref:Cobalt-zinc-cadmium efflux system protein n=1 Tax=Paraoerskovia marina TaxID=545619 RepID=A0A1H1MEA3_9CELL|nr:cation diffusion facilitator family transporter [Paraoerskovia marina]SDR84695.1 cobalt-zinc-cadmium efflux system protein [Paraoerskovia marina]
MSAGHSHGHAADATPDHRRRLAIAFGITATLFVAQVVGAVVTGSLALLVDTAHMLTDAGGLLLALVAANLTLRPPSNRRTWGFRRAEVLAALAQSALLLVVGVYVLVEGVQRLFTPPEVPSAELLVFGVVGLVGNIASLLVLSSGRDANLNLRAAFLEVLNDALGSVGVIAAAIIISTTGWQQADAVAGLLIGALILPRALKILGESAGVLLESTPRGLDLDQVREVLTEVEHVESVHDVHASLIASGLPVLSAHVVVEDGCFRDGHAPQILDQLQTCASARFAIAVERTTFQLEPPSHAHHEEGRHA